MSTKSNSGILSKAPQYEFADNLPEQEAQLAANPMMARFAVSRRELASDPHRPLYHFVSPESTLNDPNGLSFWQGRWHLFYQGYPPEDAGRVHWGHAVSDDLIHWRDLPYAIYPYQEESCYSGTALVEDDRVKPNISVAVDGEVTPLGMLEKVNEDSEVHFLPAIGGG